MQMNTSSFCIPESAAGDAGGGFLFHWMEPETKLHDLSAAIQVSWSEFTRKDVLTLGYLSLANSNIRWAITVKTFDHYIQKRKRGNMQTWHNILNMEWRSVSYRTHPEVNNL